MSNAYLENRKQVARYYRPEILCARCAVETNTNQLFAVIRLISLKMLIDLTSLFVASLPDRPPPPSQMAEATRTHTPAHLVHPRALRGGRAGRVRRQRRHEVARTGARR